MLTRILIEKLTISLVFLLPILMGTIPSSASSINILLLIIAMFWAWPSWHHLTKQEKILCLSIVAFFGAAFLSFLNSDDMSKSWARLERILRVLAFVPVFLLFRRLEIDLLKPLTLGMILAGPALLLSANLTIRFDAAQGAYNSILLGDFSAVVAVFLLCYFFFNQHSWNFKLISIIAFGCATQAMILSTTRGASVALLACAVLILGIFFMRAIKEKLFRNLLVSSLLILLTAVALIQNPTIWGQASSGVSEFRDYASGTNPHTSLGLRFQMWEASVKMWAKNPFIGSGLGDYSVDLAKMIETGQSRIREHYGEAHSIFFEFLGTTGLLGLATLLIALFVLPVRVLYSDRSKREDERFVRICGVSIIVAFFIFGLTQNWLGRSSITSVYALLLAVFLSARNPDTNAKTN